ncbi:MAG: MBL fold metallo-hydrolase [Patescibacteria group bacterium]
MKITKHGQSCFLIETKQGSRILIDPGTYVFGMKETLTPGDFQEIDVLVITHQHSDHFDVENVVKIIEGNKEHGIRIFSTTSVREILKERGIDLEVIANGQKIDSLGVAQDISITVILSQHGPKNGILPSGDKVPIVSGVLIEEKDGTSFYDPGDTIELKTTADVIATPICGKVVLNIEEAKEQLLELKPKIVIPIHYDNSAYPAEPADFNEAMKDTGIEVRVLSDGEMIEV